MRTKPDTVYFSPEYKYECIASREKTSAKWGEYVQAIDMLLAEREKGNQ